MRNWLLDTWGSLRRLLDDDAYTCVFRNVSCYCNHLELSSPPSPAHRFACQADGIHWKHGPRIPPAALNGGTGHEDKGAGLQSKHTKGQAELGAVRHLLPTGGYQPAGRHNRLGGSTLSYYGTVSCTTQSWLERWLDDHYPDPYKWMTALHVQCAPASRRFWGCRFCFGCGSPSYVTCPDTTQHAAAPGTAYPASVCTFRKFFAIFLPFLH